MRKNYEFKKNPKLPSKEEIGRHKDFDALLQRFRAGAQNPGRRAARMRRLRTVYISSAVAAAITLALILLGGVFTAPEAELLSSEDYFRQQDFMVPPIKSVAAPQFANFRVRNNEGGVYEYPSGSRLVVPAAAFANDYGQLIEGEVDVYYREMHDYVDFFMAGIPMRYDSASQRYLLESAGMIELYAEQDGERVQLVNGKTIEVELVSEILVPGINLNAPPSYNVYYLDTLINEWRYQAVDQIQLIEDSRVDAEDPLREEKELLLEELEAIEQRKAAAIAELEQSLPSLIKPLRPQVKEEGLPTFELDFLDGQMEIEDTENGRVREELSQLQQTYENVIWQVSANSPAYDERAFGVAWEAARIRPLNNRDYELTLIHPKAELTLIVRPVLFGEDYQRALDRYSAELQEYRQAAEAREEQLREARADILAQARERRTAAVAAYDAKMDAMSSTPGTDEDERYLVRRRIINRFKADQLGVWNCARTIPLNESPMALNFKDQFGNDYSSHTAYLVDYGKNTVYRFYTGGDRIPAIEADSKALIWVVTKSGQIAILRPEEVRRINQDKDKRTLRLQLLQEPMREEAQVRKALEF